MPYTYTRMQYVLCVCISCTTQYRTHDAQWHLVRCVHAHESISISLSLSIITFGYWKSIHIQFYEIIHNRNNNVLGSIESIVRIKRKWWIDTEEEWIGNTLQHSGCTHAACCNLYVSVCMCMCGAVNTHTYTRIRTTHVYTKTHKQLPTYGPVDNK